MKPSVGKGENADLDHFTSKPFKYHKYADDIQIYLFYRPHVPGDLVGAIYRLQACFRELKQLLTTLKLKLNDCKTEFIVLMSPHQLRKYGLLDLQLGTVLIKPAVSVRNLRAHFDQMLTKITRSKLHHTTCDE